MEFNEDVTLSGATAILMNFPAACHDPEHFEDPDTFIIDRARNRHGVRVRHSSSAGSNLARLEMTTALRVWMERIPEFRLCGDGEQMEWAGGQVRGPRSHAIRVPRRHQR